MIIAAILFAVCMGGLVVWSLYEPVRLRPPTENQVKVIPSEEIAQTLKEPSFTPADAQIEKSRRALQDAIAKRREEARLKGLRIL